MCVERGLYKQGDVLYACVTPPGSRTATWKSLGAAGIMEARRRRDALLEGVPERYRAAIACALFSGLRLSELLGLVWRDVDFDRGVLHVSHQLARDGTRKQLKTPAARRDVVLMPELAALLRRHRLASPFSRDEDLVFCSGRGRTVGHRNLTARGLEKAGSRAGLSGVTFHALRHTFASLLIDQGHDVVFVSRQLGHANPSITLKVYAHLFDHERHAERARDRLQTDYADLLRRGS